MTVQQFLSTLKQKVKQAPTKPIRVRPGGYSPSTRVSGQKLYPKATPSLAKSKYTKYIP